MSHKDRIRNEHVRDSVGMVDIRAKMRECWQWKFNPVLRLNKDLVRARRRHRFFGGARWQRRLNTLGIISDLVGDRRAGRTDTLAQYYRWSDKDLSCCSKLLGQ